jgi:hypothetical protein
LLVVTGRTLVAETIKNLTGLENSENGQLYKRRKRGACAMRSFLMRYMAVAVCGVGNLALIRAME